MMNFRFLMTLIIFSFSLAAQAYDPAWENFDPSTLDGARDQTIGNTQELLDERGGKVECIACHGEQNDQYDGVITTVEITEQTMTAALSCMNWEVRGVCVWLTCAVPPLCTVSTSVKVKNHVPDLVIQSYDRANGEPWTESQDINQVSQGDAESSWVTTLISWIEDFDVESVGIAGGVSTQANNKKKAGLFFKLVDAYGNPAKVAFNALGENTFGLFCQGQTWPFFPYYISNLDSIAWRWDVPEMFYPQSLIPLFTIWSLGTWSNNYGPIYPRHGFMHHEDPLKAAVLSTFRAAHFITRDATPHLYYPVSPASRDGFWPSGPLEQDDKDTGMFQMLYPDKEDSCRQFPYSADPSMNKRSDDGSYVWNFWKSYKCCKRTGSNLIFHTG